MDRVCVPRQDSKDGAKPWATGIHLISLSIYMYVIPESSKNGTRHLKTGQRISLNMETVRVYKVLGVGNTWAGSTRFGS